MIREILKKTGSIVALLALLAVGGSAQETVDTRLSPESIPQGESAALIITIPANDSFRPVLPKVKGLSIDFRTSQRSSFGSPFNMKHRTAIVYSVTPSKKGKFYIPSFTIHGEKKKYRTRPLHLTVTKGSVAAGGRSVAVRGKIEADRNKIYAGEAVVFRYYLLHGRDARNFRSGKVQRPEAKGCVFAAVDEKRPVETISSPAGELQKKHRLTLKVIPAVEGEIKIGNSTIYVEFHDGRRGYDGHIAFDSIPLTVLPLPEKGKPKNFSGNVGDYKLEVTYDKKAVTVYDERRITVKVSGSGNISAMTRPRLGENLPDVRILAEDGESSMNLAEKGFAGEKTFVYTIIPEKAGELNLGKVTLDFFDSKTKQYREVSSEEIILTVTGDAASEKRISFDEEEKEKPSFNIFLVIFIVLLVVGALVFLILWERKRYHIISSEPKKEQAPEEDTTDDALSHGEALVTALDSRDSDGFFKAADRLIKSTGAGETIDAELLAAVKNRLYGLRFGGGSLDGEAMDEIYANLKKAGLLK